MGIYINMMILTKMIIKDYTEAASEKKDYW